MNASSESWFYKNKQLSNSKSFSELFVNKRFTKPEEKTLNFHSKIINSQSRDQISYTSTKEDTELPLRSIFNPNTSRQKTKQPSPSRAEISALRDTIKNLEQSEGKGFLDKIYASNGYFWYSATRKEMSTKDALFDRLQTFCDQRLLEISSQISVKQKQEEAKINNLNYLTKLRGEICKFWYLLVANFLADLVTENDTIISFNTKEICMYNKNQDTVDQLTKQISDIRKMVAKKSLEWYFSLSYY